jgi:2-polyprenyl-3-methyl-5-hydroxy-6-metoxy-1,4-benzoquinol methylase
MSLDRGCVLCNLCNNPGRLQTATEVARIPCHVRRFRNDVFTVWRCDNCRCLHSAEDVDLAHYYADYPLKQHKLNSFFRTAYKTRLRDLVRNGLKPSDSILDYGCGVGLFVRFLEENGYTDVAGFDLYVPDFSNGSVLDRVYDAVVTYDVLEHVENVFELLNRLKSLVKPGGILAIETPNADNIPLHEKPYPPAELSQPYHRHLLSKTRLVELGAECGLVAEFESHRYMDTLLPGLNMRFVWNYVNATGGMLDASLEPIRPGVILRKPSLVFDALFGYFLPSKRNVLVVFRRRQ